MAAVTRPEPQSATEYDARTTAAVTSVLLEIGQILGSYRGRFAVVGGAVPGLLLPTADMPHVGTMDVDLSLDAEALGDGDYARLVESLLQHGYQQRAGFRVFQLVREVPALDGGPPIRVVVDFLRPNNDYVEKNRPPLIDNFAVIKADGADLATRFFELVTLDGRMPGGGRNAVQIAVCSIPALLAMKGHAIVGRQKNKDAYDIYYCVRNYPGGAQALAEACRPVREHPGGSGRRGFAQIAGKFRAPDDFGPTCVGRFVRDSSLLDGRTVEQWQMDAYGQVAAWLAALDALLPTR